MTVTLTKAQAELLDELLTKAGDDTYGEDRIAANAYYDGAELIRHRLKSEAATAAVDSLAAETDLVAHIERIGQTLKLDAQRIADEAAEKAEADFLATPLNWTQMKLKRCPYCDGTGRKPHTSGMEYCVNVCKDGMVPDLRKKEGSNEKAEADFLATPVDYDIEPVAGDGQIA